MGRILFRHQAPWEQRRKTIVLLWSVAVGLFFGALLMVLLGLIGTRR